MKKILAKIAAAAALVAAAGTAAAHGPGFGVTIGIPPIVIGAPVHFPPPPRVVVQPAPVYHPVHRYDPCDDWRHRRPSYGYHHHHRDRWSHPPSHPHYGYRY